MTPRQHPLGIESSPDWDGVWSRYIALSEGIEPEDDAPLATDEREPTNAPVFLAVMAVLIIGLSLAAAATNIP